MLFSMGRSGIMPSLFSQLHTKYKTPYVAIMFLVAIDASACKIQFEDKLF
ncbi:hypothetical protein JPSP42_20550 [Staphylococcus pseudintermedius]